MQKHTRYSIKSSLLMFDIDHFKTVNDTYGHQAGDDVLVAIARACESILRDSDLLARYGGEEFIVLLPETEQAGALEVAEKIRQTVEALKTPWATSQIQVTVSIGVAGLGQREALSLDAAIKLADDCLYRAKDRGRNTICVNDQLN